MATFNKQELERGQGGGTFCYKSSNETSGKTWEMCLQSREGKRQKLKMNNNAFIMIFDLQVLIFQNKN